MKSIVVFCGSSAGTNPKYADMAYQLGRLLALEDIVLVYGGAKVGLMGKVADGCLSENGKVVGVIPDFLKRREIVHDDLTELITTATMAERKSLMSQRSEGCIALPGGYGTLEELFELLTDAQLGHYPYPIGMLNIDGYYDLLIQMLDQMVKNGLLRSSNRGLLIVEKDIKTLLRKMTEFQVNSDKKWL